jgi:cyclic pyranopterin phosphate synthase
MHALGTLEREARFIPIYAADASRFAMVDSEPSAHQSLRAALAGEPLLDAMHRPLRDLRISITDQCNFRCRYCMPREQFGAGHVFLPQKSLLDFDELEFLVRTAICLGVRKVRLTGGEPLLRKGVEALVERLAALRTLDNKPLEIAMTTNGSLLKRKAAGLKAAGLSRLTVSLDALDDAVFKRMNDAEVSVGTVLEGIDTALSEGFDRIKVNVVVRKGWNEDQILPLARHFLGRPVVLRFIEFMDVGNSNAWSMQHVFSSAQTLAVVKTEFQVNRLVATHPGETAQRWAYSGTASHGRAETGELGLIGSVTAPFCGDCNRARITADGKIFTCLFGQSGVDLLPSFRPSDSPKSTDLLNVLAGVWSTRVDRYSEGRRQRTDADCRGKAEMSYLGG